MPFNEIDRTAFQEAVRRYVPQLAPWVDTCYSEPSWLVLGDTKLSSVRGIQHGDPLGPGLFGMGVQQVVEEAVRGTQTM